MLQVQNELDSTQVPASTTDAQMLIEEQKQNITSDVQDELVHLMDEDDEE